MTSKITLGLGDNPGAAELREDVFVREQGFENEFDDIDPIAHHLVLSEDGRPAATGRAFPDPDRPDCYILGRIAVDKALRGRHLGERVVRELEALCARLGARRCHLSAQLQARGFYERLGYQAQGEPYLDEHCPHISMEKELANGQ